MKKAYMKKALDLAKKAEGFTKSNPMVGCLLVKDGNIIAQGYHKGYGMDHGEIEALKKADDPRGSTAYVNLEPCCHHGKTGPCCQALVEAGVRKVYIGHLDPNPLVSGKGLAYLKRHGLEVEVGVLEEESKKLNEVFIKYISTSLPFIAIKSAMTLDGKIACKTGDSKWITGSKSRHFVHELRHKYMAIMVGVNTVLRDDPSLDTRIEGLQSPIRVIVDSKGRTPLDSKVLNHKDSKTLIATTKACSQERREAYWKKGAELIVTDSKDGRVDLRFLLEELHKRSISSVLVEGGGELNYSLIEEKLLDKLYLFIGPKIFGGRGQSIVAGKGVDKVSDAFPFSIEEIRKFDQDLLLECYRR